MPRCPAEEEEAAGAAEATPHGALGAALTALASVKRRRPGTGAATSVPRHGVPPGPAAVHWRGNVGVVVLGPQQCFERCKPPRYAVFPVGLDSWWATGT